MTMKMARITASRMAQETSLIEEKERGRSGGFFLGGASLRISTSRVYSNVVIVGIINFKLMICCCVFKI